MVKAKLIVPLRGATGAWGVPSSMKVNKSVELQVKDSMCRTVLSRKPFTRPQASKKQAEQRDKYCSCDRYLVDATDGQLFTWKRYYWKMRAGGATLKTYVKTHKKKKVEGGSEHMGYRAFFLKLCLTDKLEVFSYSWLKAKWQIDYLLIEDHHVKMRACIVHREGVRVGIEPREFKYERPRF